MQECCICQVIYDLTFFYLGFREMVHMAVDSIGQILDLPGLSLKNDFCHIFARSSVLARLVTALHSLNEAVRMPSALTQTERLLEHSSEKVSFKSQSGPIDQTRVTNKEGSRNRSGQLDDARGRPTHPDHQKNYGEVLSRTQLGQAHRASGLPEFSWQNIPGQLEFTRQRSGHLTPSKGTSLDRLSDHYQPGYGESTWVMGGDGRRERDDEARSDGEARPLLADEAWRSPRRMNGLEHEQVWFSPRILHDW